MNFRIAKDRPEQEVYFSLSADYTEGPITLEAHTNNITSPILTITTDGYVHLHPDVNPHLGLDLDGHRKINVDGF